LNNLLITKKNEIIFSKAIDDANKIIANSNAKNTIRAIEKDLQYIRCWYQANGIDDNIVKKEHLILFIIQHAENMPRHIDEILVNSNIKSKYGLHKITTVKRRIKSLSMFLKLKKLNNPCLDIDVKILINKLIKKNGCGKAWGKAITLDILNDMLDTCTDGLIGIRDSALLLFAFSSGGRRRSEVSSVIYENLKRNSDGNYIYNLGKSKTNQIGEVDFKPIAGRAALALMNWLYVSGITEGYIFRGIRKGGKEIFKKGISDKQIARIIKNRCEKAGYDSNQYTAHSIRSGFVTEAGKKGKPIGDIMALTGHKCVEQVMHYYQSGAIINNSAAYLAG
jgi:integrase